MSAAAAPMTRGNTAALSVLGLLIFALIAAGQALHVPGELGIGSDRRMAVFVGLEAIAGACYLAAVALVLRHSLPGRALWLVLGLAAAMRLIPLVSPSFLSSDLFRYVWDGRVQLAGINPYRYIPADPALQGLRDPAIFPFINRADYAQTIYQPTAQLIFAAIAWISQTPYAVKAAMVGFEILAIAAMLRLLVLAGLPRTRVLIYAWNPVPVWEFAGNGHVDGAALGLVALALLARGTRRPAWAGVALAAATAIKFLPAVLAPALWRRWDWRMPAAFVATIAALYLCYAGAGWRIFGFLSSYAGEEGLRTGSGVWLLAGLQLLVPLPAAAGTIYLAGVALCLTGIGLWMAFARRPLAGSADILRLGADTALLATFLLIAISPHYPWYFPWLALSACLAPYRSTVFLSVACLLLYLDPLHERFVWPALVYLPAIVLAVLDLKHGLPRKARGAAPRPCWGPSAPDPFT
ncbi:MAG: DUF2029 domain-containing protein [Acidisphaera sp.]|nr:DUF2029 domain-containing protein [Acidisphaera sp.]